jgi:mediator of RNA polymerase II transcription subunit 10
MPVSLRSRHPKPANEEPTIQTPSPELLTLRDAASGRKKQTCIIISDGHCDKYGFLTLHLSSNIYKERYKTLVNDQGHQVVSGSESPKEQVLSVAVGLEGSIPGVEAAEQGSSSGVKGEVQGHPNEIEAAATKSAIVAKDRPGPEVSEDQDITEPPGIILDGKQPPVDQVQDQDVRPTVESHPLQTTKEVALESQAAKAFAEDERIKAGAGDVGPQDPTRDSEPGHTALEGVEPTKTTLQAGLRIDTSQAATQSGRSSLEDKQTGLRGVKRSKTPEPPSLTSGGPSAPSTPDSQSAAESRRPSTAEAEVSPRKKATARGYKTRASARVPSYFARPQKIVTLQTSKLPQGWLLDPVTMAPVRDPTDVSSKIKDVVQNLYDVQSQTHGFVPQTQDLLIGKMEELTQSLADLQRLTDRTQSPNNPVHNIDLAPEIVDYVDDGRNPDIFTRDFVELVQRGNAVLNGKKQAFRDFSQVFARALKEGIGGVDKHVDMVMENAGIEQDETGKTVSEESTANGQRAA